MPTTRRRFQFSLRKLFFINVGIALVMGALRIAVVGTEGAMFLLAPGLWLLGIVPVVVFAALGDIFGGRSGAVVGALGAGALCGVLIFFSSTIVGLGKHDSIMSFAWNLQGIVAIGLTILYVIQSAWQSRRAEKFAAQHPSKFIHDLSDVRERNSIQMAARWRRKTEPGPGVRNDPEFPTR